MFMGWQTNDDGHFRAFVGLEMIIRVKDSFHKHVLSTYTQRAYRERLTKVWGKGTSKKASCGSDLRVES